jgi:hypothetical protein
MEIINARDIRNMAIVFFAGNAASCLANTCINGLSGSREAIVNSRNRHRRNVDNIILSLIQILINAQPLNDGFLWKASNLEQGGDQFIIFTRSMRVEELPHNLLFRCYLEGTAVIGFCDQDVAV